MTRLSDRREQRRLAGGLPCRGRPLDGDLDTAIRAAVLSLLGEVGYERMTMDAVASRATVSKATIYRRWDSKASLIVETLRACQFDEMDLPDSGDVRADLLTCLQAFRATASGSEGQLFNGVLMAMRIDAELARLVRERMILPKQQRARAWLQTYVDRGLLPADADINVFHEVGVALLVTRLMLTGEPVDDAFLVRLVDDVLLPLLNPRPKLALTPAERNTA